MLVFAQMPEMGNSFVGLARRGRDSLVLSINGMGDGRAGNVGGEPGDSRAVP